MENKNLDNDVSKSVGDTNGKIAKAFRINQILIPIIGAMYVIMIGLLAWIGSMFWEQIQTNHQEIKRQGETIAVLNDFKNKGERYTMDDAAALKEYLLSKIETNKYRLDKLPPTALIKKVDELKDQIDSNHAAISLVRESVIRIESKIDKNGKNH